MSEEVDSGWLIVDGKSKNLAPPDIYDRRAVKHASRGLQPTVKTVLNFVSHGDIGTGPQNSTQQISIIHRQIMPRYKLSVFRLEGRFFMMLPLASDVLNGISHLRFPDRERAVSVLPRKRLQRRPLPGNPFRRLAFKTPHPFAKSYGRGQAYQEMDVIFHAANLQSLHSMRPAYTAHVTPNALFDIWRDPTFTILGRENEMQVDGGVGVCHIRNDGLSGTLLRCRYATQYSSAFRIRGLKPTATVLDRAAVDSSLAAPLYIRGLRPTATVLDRAAVDLHHAD